MCRIRSWFRLARLYQIIDHNDLIMAYLVCNRYDLIDKFYRDILETVNAEFKSFSIIFFFSHCNENALHTIVFSFVLMNVLFMAFRLFILGEHKIFEMNIIVTAN